MLVALQMALTFTLIVGASLAGRTFYNLLRIDPGFNPRNVLTMEIELPRGHYDYKRIDAFHENLLMRIRQLPGVIAASTSDGLPLLDQGSHFLFQVEGGAAQSSNGYDAYSSWVSTGYFHTLGVPLLVGRDFDETDRNHPVLIVNRTLARQLGAAQDVIGKRLQPNGGDDSYEIIGVVEDECYRASQLTGKLDISPRTYFLRYSSGHVNLALRVKTDPQSLAPTARTVIRDMDSQLVIRGVRLMDDVFREPFQLQQLGTLLMGVFAIFTFALGFTGLYGVVTHSTRSRLGEIAIRMAVGAGPVNILMMVLLHGVKVTTLGIGLGLSIVLALARVTASLLYGVAPLDPWILAGAVLLLGMASVGTCLLPACRAARNDPRAAFVAE